MNAEAQFLVDFIEARPWQFAKTMPKIPHEYTVKRGRDDVAFARFVELIKTHGERRFFAGRPYHYLTVGDREYWAIHPVINRQLLTDRPKLDGEGEG